MAPVALLVPPSQTKRACSAHSRPLMRDARSDERYRPPSSALRTVTPTVSANSARRNHIVAISASNALSRGVLAD
jgi:hypothetical protein